jgi:carbon-monoxide dehydrogenase medium subunit
VGDPARLGALATHAEIGGLEGGAGALGAVAEAARRSAFPAVRNVATIAGNLAARPFPEADLVPALLAAEAVVELAGPEGSQRVDAAAYIAQRGRRPAGEVIIGVTLPAPAARRAWFERLTVRHAAEYALASVAVSVDLDADGVVADARVAIGSVEELAARSNAAEAVLRGRPLSELPGEEAGHAAAAELHARDGVDAPAWYRLAVLPGLVRRAVTRLAAV